MKERPIIMSAESVNAILDGRKTQTRRVIKPQPILMPFSGRWTWYKSPKSKNLHVDASRPWWSYAQDAGELPYGVGNRLWVREAWACVGAEHVKPIDISPDYRVHYRANDIKDTWFVEVWRPSIHMPRWASRITLEIVDVRVERVKQISMDDVIAEGLDFDEGQAAEWFEEGEHLHAAGSPMPGEVYAFASLWNSLNEKRGYGWDANPWVWVIEFRNLED